MADAILSVSLEAQVNNFRGNLQAAAQEMNRTSQATERAVGAISSNIARVNTINLGGFQRSLQAGQISLGRLNTTAAATAGSLRPLTVGSNQAGQALTNLGRVAQDAPFGFIGIQNNLNPLLESFQRLRVETGSNGAALRALGQSLVGPAGLGIALSVVSAAVLFYQQYQQRAAKETANSEAAMKKAKKTSEEYALSLDDVTRAQLQGAQSAQKELTELQTLYAITQNTNVSLRQRGQAVDELQKKYPEYFKNIKDEAILTGNAKDAYDRLATSILATARARAAQDIIVKNSSRQLENEQKITDALVEYDKQRVIAAKNLAIIRGGGTGQGAQGYADQAARAEERQADAAKLIRDLKKDNQLIDTKNLKLTESITAEVIKGADLAGKVGDLPKEKKAKAKPADVISSNLAEISAIIKKNNDENLQNTLNAQEKELSAINIRYENEAISIKKSAEDALKQRGITSEQIKNIKKVESDALLTLEKQESEARQQILERDLLATEQKIRDSITQIVREGKNEKIRLLDFDIDTGNPLKSQIDTVTTSIDILKGKYLDGLINFQEYQSQIEKLAEGKKILSAQEKFNVDFDNLVKSGLGATIGSIGGAIGEALVAGGDIFSAAGGALLAGFGQFLDQFGKLLVEYGAAAILKSKLDAAILIPGAGIFAGAAAIAAGIALQIAAGAIGSLASGKNQSGNKGQKNQPTAFANGGVVFGPTNALIGEYAGARNNPEVVAPLSKLKSMIGGGEQIYIAENVIRGQDIVTSYNKASSTLRRVN